MKEIWNEICYRCKNCIDNNVQEKNYENEFVNCLSQLGWMQWKQEVTTQYVVPIGHERKRVDIVVSLDGIEQFTIEMKRPGHKYNENDQLQLFSYMRLLPHQVKFGFYIGENIRIYYDEPHSNSLPRLVSIIEFEQDNPSGINLISLICKKNFSQNKLQEFCQKELDKQKAKLEMEKEFSFLQTTEGINILKKNIVNIYVSKGFSQELAYELVNRLIIKIENPLCHNIQTATNTQTKNKNTKDRTKYLFNGKLYGKCRLPQIVIKEYVRKHPNTYINIEQILESANVCNPSIIKPIDMEEKLKCRYHMKEKDIITSTDGIQFVVCHEWNKDIIPIFLKWAKNQGLIIEPMIQ